MNAEDEAEWRAEFEKIGEERVRELVATGIIYEPKRQLGFRWLGERARALVIAETEHQQNERTMALWTRRLGILTIVLAVTAGIAAFIAGLTAWISYEADQTSRLRDRAFVYFSDPPVSPYPPGNPTVWSLGITIANAGNMPARRVAVRFACPNAPFSDEIPDTFRLVNQWNKAEIASVIGPKQGASLQACNVPIEIINEAKRSLRRIFYLVEVTYLDGFYLGATRITQMSRAFSFDPYGGQSLSFTRSRNCSDDDCPK